MGYIFSILGFFPHFSCGTSPPFSFSSLFHRENSTPCPGRRRPFAPPITTSLCSADHDVPLLRRSRRRRRHSGAGAPSSSSSFSLRSRSAGSPSSLAFVQIRWRSVRPRLIHGETEPDHSRSVAFMGFSVDLTPPREQMAVVRLLHAVFLR